MVNHERAISQGNLVLILLMLTPSITDCAETTPLIKFVGMTVAFVRVIAELVFTLHMVALCLFFRDLPSTYLR